MITGPGRRRRLAAFLAIAGAAALAAAIWPGRPPSLEFRDVPWLPGYRELVLQGGSSRLDPLTAALPLDGAPRPQAVMEDASDLCRALMEDPAAPAIGPREGAGPAVAAFLDYRCPYCKTLAPVLAQVQHDLDLRVIYREWPILGESSALASRAALAAARQGRYAEFHARLMASGFIPTDAYVDSVASALGLDNERLRADMGDSQTGAALARTADVAARLRLAGTPALVVGRTIVRGSVTRRELIRLIEMERTAPDRGTC